MLQRPSHIVLVLLIWTGSVLAVDARNEAPRFSLQIWLTENGLPQNTVHAITQTKNGYLWIGTEGGLARFDGLSFKVFDRQNTPEIRSNYIRSLLEDRDGNLWIGTADGLLRLQGGVFVALTTADGLPHNSIQSLYQDRQGNLWVATAGGLGILKHGSSTNFTLKERSISGSIQAVFEDKEGALWIATPYGLSQFKDGRFSNFTERDGLGSNSVRAIQQTSDGKLWFGTLSGLSLFANGRFSTYTKRDGLNSERVLSLLAGSDGTLLVGTAGGLNKLIENSFANFAFDHGLSTHTILSLFEDLEGSLWVGTESGGLNLLRVTKFTTYSMKDGLSSNLVKTIFGSNNNNDIWIGTDGGGLNLLRNGRLSNFTTKQGLTSNVVLALFTDGEGTVWTGTPDGLNRFSKGRFDTHRLLGAPANEYVRSIYRDSRGELWIGTRSGLTRIKGAASKTFNEADGLPNDFITALSEDPEGGLWIGSRGGLAKFHNEEFTTYTVADGLSHDEISALYQDADGTIWIGTNGGGLNRFSNGTLTSFTTNEGLIDDVIYSVLEDHQHNLWFSSSKGIFRVNKTEFDALARNEITTITATTYGTADGMLTRECSGGGSPAAWKDNLGRLWFSTIRGVAMIDPTNIKINQRPPPVVIEQLRIDEKPVLFSESVEVSPGQTRFDFYYTAPSFIAPETIRFKYKLDGFDPDWIDAGMRRVAYYTNLRPGNYRFQVIASNNDGIWNEVGASFGFYLKPYFYQTYWFYSLCLLALALLGWLVYRYRLRRMQAQFGAVLAERSRIAREIHDNLAQEMLGVSVQLELVARTLPPSAEVAKQHLDRVRILVRHGIAEARRYVWDLRSQALDNNDLPTALAETAHRLTDSTPIQVQVNVMGTFRRLGRLVEDNLLRLGQEAINNAVQHAQPKHIFVHLRFDTRQVQLSVRDDGEGFDYELYKTKGDHFGLVGMRERAEQIGGTLSIHSANGSGTEVLVDVPINNTS